MPSVFHLHYAATWALVGLIWTIQIIHYPLFGQVGREQFISYHQRHTRLITLVVGPLMLAELGTAVLLVLTGTRDPWFIASLPLLASIWISTWMVQIPLHNTLANGFDAKAHHRLVTTNWWRTAAWSARGICIMMMA
ncbi:MAG TPA: hypothetical protein DCR70_08695 [Phycisphaerales bacterium]|nr:hypothetical protein [Phycisphaerales bacterium]